MSAHADELRDVFRGFFARESPPARVRAAEDAQPPGFDGALWARAGELGLPAMDGATLAELAVAAREYGRAVAPIPLVETLVASRLLTRVGADGAPALPTVALQPAAGVAHLVPAGAVADAVVALDGHELVVATDGAVATAVPNLARAPLATWSLTSRTVLARGADAAAQHARAVDEWRVLTGAALVGLGQRAVEIGVDYAKARHQFGVPIGSFQAIQHRLADVATAVDAADLLVAHAATTDRPDPELAAAAFLAATRGARDAAAASLHVHGGYGFMLEYDIQLYFRRAAAWPLALGDPADELARLGDLLADAGWALPELPPSAFRAEVRAVLADAGTDEAIARADTTGTVHDWAFHRRLAGQGLVAAGWEPEWGGQGRDDREVLALWEELERAGAPTDGWGTSELVARTLAVAGTDEQRHRIVPRVLSGEILICLGYSEPDSGSDVAAAATRAERDGDQWVVNGQKMFTTLAHEASYVFLLTRTNPDVAKHRGLTMFLVPMDTPGIEVTPILTLSGERTNITYYTDVRVADEWRVGAVDGGWDVMRVALAFERRPTMVGELDRLLRQYLEWARRRPGLLVQAPVRTRLASAFVDLEAGRRLSERMAALTAAGELPIVEGSMAKLWSSEALVRAAASLLDTLGVDGVLSAGAPDAPAGGAVELMHRHSQVTTIRAGTSEIQRTIIAERGLGLPRSGR